jgi:thioredoxin 1
MSNLTSVNDATFKAEVLEAELPVFVDFFGTWCAPCQAIAPIVDRLAEQYEGKVKFVKVDIDQAPDTASNVGVQGVPTLVMFRGGQEVRRMVGAGSASAIERLIETALS